MQTVVRGPITHRCPYRDEVDHGTIEIVFDGEARELHEVAEYLDAFRYQEISHEKLTRKVAVWLGARVTTRWTTAGLDVEVTVE